MDPPPWTHTPHPQAGVALPGLSTPREAQSPAQPNTSCRGGFSALWLSLSGSPASVSTPHPCTGAPAPTNSQPPGNPTALFAQACLPSAPGRGGPNLFQAMMSSVMFTVHDSGLLLPTLPTSSSPRALQVSLSSLCLALINWFPTQGTQ
jgi:hypothetical protein